MTNKLDYNNEAVLDILNNPSYNDNQKKELFEKYKKDLIKNRKDEIVSRLNELAKNIPSITKEDYIQCLKKYENDDLTKPFEVIEEELKNFEKSSKQKYEDYLNNQKLSSDLENNTLEEPILETFEDSEKSDELIPDVTPSIEEMNINKNDEFDDTLFKSPEDFKNDITPTEFMESEQVSVLNEEPEILAKPLFEETEGEVKNIMPEDIIDDNLGEKGNASAIILSIIAIIIGISVMYSIIKLK